jgi:DNA mismatch repair protein MutL
VQDSITAARKQSLKSSSGADDSSQQQSSTVNPTKQNRIEMLDARLANQIAAGEVVERPASVVKELIENCIDAGAKKIEVEIERGGTRLIKITDDGKGIHKDDLALALTRHATSKIKTTHDLARISSLGFRGEALASISSVAKLCLTSRQRSTSQDTDQNIAPDSNASAVPIQAWQAVASGRDMKVEILPAAAQEGTRIEVADLFFNTPARQKFLRTEKTEFNHIEEVFKRHALANFDISFVLKHNHKVVKRVPACGDPEQYKKRLANICGKGFADHAIAFSCDHELVQLSGWLGAPSFHRSESDIQYVFINGRPVKDKTLNHAIKQAYGNLIPVGRMATYVIFVTMDPTQVDVNVHPTKHEVRFSEQRLIHDLLAKSISESICADIKANFNSHNAELNFSQNQTSRNTDNNQYKQNSTEQHNFMADSESLRTDKIQEQEQEQEQPSYSGQSYYKHQSRYAGSFKTSTTGNSINELYGSKTNQTAPKQQSTEQLKAGYLPFQKQAFVAAIYRQDGFSLAQIDGQSIAIKNEILITEYIDLLLQKQKISASKALLFPLPLTLKSEILELPQSHQQLERLGFIYTVDLESQQLLLKQVPLWLAQFSTNWIIEQLQQWFALPLEHSGLTDKILLSLTHQSAQSVNLLDYVLSEMQNDIFAGTSWRVIQKTLLSELFEEHAP